MTSSHSASEAEEALPRFRFSLPFGAGLQLKSAWSASLAPAAGDAQGASGNLGGPLLLRLAGFAPGKGGSWAEAGRLSCGWASPT